jgi:hypothetical protein
MYAERSGQIVSTPEPRPTFNRDGVAIQLLPEWQMVALLRPSHR